MPLYEYRCLDCGDHVEVLQKLSDRPLKRCDKCSGKMEKLISRTSFQLKGGGWYAHGYGNPGSGSPSGKSESGKSESGKSESSQSGSSQSKKDGAKGGSKDGGTKKSGGKEGSSGSTRGSSAASA